MGTFFEEGGWGMYPTTIFGFVLVAAAVLSVLRPQLKWDRVTKLLTVITLASGALGTSMGLISTMNYVARSQETEYAKIAMKGVAESLNNLVLALVIVIPALLVASVAALRSLKRSAPEVA